MKRKKRIIILISVLACITALALWIAWGNSALMVSEFSIQSERVPEGLSGYKIAQVSDLHNAEFGDNNADLLALLEAAEPDIIVLTGDLIDSRKTDIDIAGSFAEKAVEIAPTYFVTGNHEARIDGYAELRDNLIAAGVTVLENEAVTIEKDGNEITLLGINDPSFQTDYLMGDSASVVQSALDGLVDDEQYTILLSHRPELFETYAGAGVDLVFSGHAHGGQFRIPFLGGVIAPNQGFFPKYDAGLYTQGNTNMVVSRGLGNSLFPFRVNNRPELIIVELGK